MFVLQDIIFRFLIAGLLGALLGTQREIRNFHKFEHNDENFGGIRTYTLISLFGSLATYAYLEVGDIWILLVPFILVGGLVMLSFNDNLKEQEGRDLLSELAALMSFLVGILCITGPVTIPIIIGVSIPAILALKSGAHKVLHHVTQEVFMDAIKFAIVAFVILPLLPNNPVDPWGIINPFQVWFFVVIVTAISFSGYVVSRIVGTGRGILITSLIGGLASSTAVTLHLSALSKLIKGKTAVLTTGIILASFIMFLRLELLIMVVAPGLAMTMLKCFVPMAFTAGVVLLWLHHTHKNGRKEEHPMKELEVQSSFRILPAIKFGLFYIAVQVIGYVSNYFFGDAGVYFFSAAAGIADVDPPTYILATQYMEGVYPMTLVAQGIVIAAVMNTLVKGIIPLVIGRRDVGLYVLATFLPMAVIGIISAFLFT